MSVLPTSDADNFRHGLEHWYEGQKQDYPWRQTADPWHILVSEVMLQQTQVSTVLGKGFYLNFLERFPSPQSIANAAEQEILSAWEGLGYYRRVRNLQKAARAICNDHAGEFPRKHSDILDLPGIGRYTAGAVSSFAYNQAQPIVDANVARIFARLFNFQQRVDSSAGQKQLWQWAEQLLDHANPRSYNSALMELGQQVCHNKNPACDNCPVQAWCTATEPTGLPLKKAPKKTVFIEEHCILALCPNTQRILLTQADVSERRSGMWKLPEHPSHQLEDLALLHQSRYAITHHRVSLHIYDCDPLHPLATTRSEQNLQWHPLSSLDDLPMPSPFRKALSTLLADCF